MTINNRTWAMPSIAVVLLRMFEAHPDPLEPDAIYARVAPPAGLAAASGINQLPPALGDEAKVNSGVDETLQLLLEFGVLAQSERGLALASGLPTRREGDSDRAYVGRLLRVQFLEPQHNESLWESDRGARDFSRAIAWYLMQDVESAPRNFDTAAPLQQKQIDGAKAQAMVSSDSQSTRDYYLVTKTRWPVFIRWAVFTGFARSDLGGHLPDPTEAVEDTLNALPIEEPWPVGDFVAALSSYLPLIDGGIYWEDVRSQLTAAAAKNLGDALSSSLSHALLRLEDRNALLLTDRADAPDKKVLRDGTRRRRVSHVQVVR